MSTFEYGGDLSRDDFYKKAIQPNFPNRMQFVLTASDVEGQTFSEEGMDAVTEQIESFIMARILGTWRKTKTAPHELTVNVDLEFKARSEHELRQGAWPWWALVDKGNHPLDGGHRGEAHDR